VPASARELLLLLLLLLLPLQAKRSDFATANGGARGRD
jgi:hypothetical protein